jgi:6-phosphogluconolactonase
MADRVDVRVTGDLAALARAAAEEFVRIAEEAIRARGRFTVALSGGSTPRGLHRQLAAGDRDRIDWRAVHVFWGDERHVPPDHSESNFRMARETLLDAVPVPPENVHRILAENPDAALAAADYEATLREAFGLARGELPRFDLLVMGIGEDGHTASLFPGSDALRERERLVVAPWVEKLGTFRITLTPPVLNHGANVLFLVSGEEKAEAVQTALEGERDPERCPAQIVRPQSGSLLWLLDRAAASRLASKPEE